MKLVETMRVVMRSTKLSAALWALVAAVALLFVVHSGSYPFSWGDVFWQIKSGEWVWQHRGVPWTDPFAFTTQGHTWVEHEWLTDLVDYAIVARSGLLGLRLSYTLLWLLCALHFGLSLARRYREPLPTALALFGSLVFLQRQFIPAPSTVFLAFTYAMTLMVSPSAPRRSPARIVLSVTVFYLWCCMHSQALLFLGFLGPFAAWPRLRRRILGLRPASSRTSAPRREANDRDRWALFLGCLGVSFLTPYTWRVHQYALQGPEVARLIDEWQPLLTGTYVNFPGKLLAVSTLGLLALAIVRRAQTLGAREGLFGHDAWHSFIALGSAGLMLQRSRFVWLGIIPLIYALDVLWPRGRVARSHIAQPLFVGLCLLAFLSQFGWTPPRALELATRNYYRFNLRPGSLPQGAARYLLAHPTPGNMFNHYGWGGYLVYRLYPRYRVFIDGRTVLFGSSLVHHEQVITHRAPGALELLDAYHIRIMVVAPGYFTPEQSRRFGWTLRFKDRTSAVYTR